MRIIPKIEIKNSNLVKGIGFEGLRVLGNPDYFINKYNNSFADEIFIIDVTASLYGLKHDFSILEKFCSKTTIPINVSGGLRNIDDIYKAFGSGADKVSLNTTLYEDIKIIETVSKNYGSQAINANLEVIQNKENSKLNLFCEFGKEPKKEDFDDFIKKLIDAGIGEIIVSSVLNDGTLKGADYKLLERISKISEVPILYSGGIKSLDEIKYIKKNFEIDGLLVSSLFHYNLIKFFYKNKNLKSRDKIGNKEFISIKQNILEKIKDSEIEKKFFNENIKTNLIKKDQYPKICIIDLTVGNIFSIKNFLENMKIPYIISNKESDITNCDILIISGDCNSGYCINQIKKLKIEKIIKTFFEKKILIGICSGMQIMFDKLDEGNEQGLSLLKGQVKKINNKKGSIKLPNVGWKKINSLKKNDKLKINNKEFYFLHSFTIYDFEEKDCYYEIDYNGVKIPSVFIKNNSYFFQFHPEKSRDYGGNLLYSLITNIKKI